MISDVDRFVLREIVSEFNGKPPAERRALVEVVQRMGVAPDILGFLKAVAGQDKDPDVRFYARRALDTLGNLPGAGLVPAQEIEIAPKNQPQGDLQQVVACLTKEKDPALLATLVKHVGQVGGPAEAPHLMALLIHSDPRVVANCVEAIALLKPDEVFEVLLPLVNHGDNRVRANAVLACSRVDLERTLTYIRQMLASEHLAMRSSAIYCLSQIDDKNVMPVLITTFRLEKDPELRKQVAMILGERAGEEALTELARINVKKNPSLRGLVDYILEEMGARLKLSRAELEIRLAAVRKKDRAKKVAETLSLSQTAFRATRVYQRDPAAKKTRVKVKRTWVDDLKDWFSPEALRQLGVPIVVFVVIVFGGYSAFGWLMGPGSEPRRTKSRKIRVARSSMFGKRRPKGTKRVGSGHKMTVRGKIRAIRKGGILVRAKYDYFLVLTEGEIEKLDLTRGDTVTVKGNYVGWEPPGVTVLKGSSFVKGN